MKASMVEPRALSRGLIPEVRAGRDHDPSLLLPCFFPSGQNLVWMHSALEVTPSVPFVNSTIRVATRARGPLFTMFLTVSSCPT